MNIGWNIFANQLILWYFHTSNEFGFYKILLSSFHKHRWPNFDFEIKLRQSNNVVSSLEGKYVDTVLYIWRCKMSLGVQKKNKQWRHSQRSVGGSHKLNSQQRRGSSSKGDGESKLSADRCREKEDFLIWKKERRLEINEIQLMWVSHGEENTL